MSLMLDEFSIARLGSAVPRSGSCLEVGAGNGSVACWLAERVGSDGQVIATDVKTHHIRHHPGVRMLRHDVAADELPAGSFDVVHVRLLLSHLPSRLEVLARLIAGLRPGGLLVVEEFGYAGRSEMLVGPNRSAMEVYAEFQAALAEVHAAAGGDAGWAVDAHAAMREAGLSDVDTETHARSWRGGSAGCFLPLAVSIELREQLIVAGMVERELDRLAELMTDPTVIVMGDLLWSHLGRRPADPDNDPPPAPIGGAASRRGPGLLRGRWVNQVAYLDGGGQ